MTERLITIERDIAARRPDVWKVLADFPNISDWNSGVKASRATSGATTGVGATRHCDLAPAGSLDETVTEWDDERRLVITIDRATVVPIARGEVTFTLGSSASDGRTRTVMEYRYQPKGGPFGLLLGPALDRRLAKGFAGFLVDLEAAAQQIG
ncbi:SRPBCC family protein [Mycobacterium spongiae]|uniref:SRPBCC family protein n=1 Tax=Mycobacterium spongiae TaxID=886343 RepID=A0A975PWR2_9MYCO|nr:SRPBCC family protein [Mycobacterium spongiae]QUR66943.1 SRPBCC family protein [Mycobacterium spongiae]